MWQQSDDGNTYNWYEASGTYDSTDNPNSNSVCAGLSLAGHSDWRLPNTEELAWLINYDKYKPSTDSTYFSTTNPSRYWSSDTVAGFPAYAWRVNFYNGLNNGYYKSTGAYYVRCVRAGFSAASTGFTDNSDGTVTDNRTGLIWLQDDDSVLYDWIAAITHCEGLSLAGYSDWRLPNIIELRTLVDYARSNPAIDTVIFQYANPSLYYWSSTTDASYTSNAWTVGFYDGYDYNRDKSDSNYMRCVR